MARKKQIPISFYDAAILAAAQELECGTVYSEDMSHGKNHGGVTVVNPNPFA